MVARSGVFGFCFLGGWVVVVWSGVPRWSRDLVLVSWAVFGGLLGIWWFCDGCLVWCFGFLVAGWRRLKSGVFFSLWVWFLLRKFLGFGFSVVGHMCDSLPVWPCRF